MTGGRGVAFAARTRPGERGRACHYEENGLGVLSRAAVIPNGPQVLSAYVSQMRRVQLQKRKSGLRYLLVFVHDE